MKISARAFLKAVFVTVVVLVLWIMLPQESAVGFSAGAPAGYCGAPSNGGSTCFVCHNDGSAPVTVPGMITSNIPVTGYVPGSTYIITASVAAQGYLRFGFEISPQDAGGNLIGSMNDLGSETIFQAGGVYITHSSNQILTPDSKFWQFEWTAPSAGSGTATFYGAFNITNNDGSYTGDSVLISTLVVQEDISLNVNSVSSSGWRIYSNESGLHIHGIPADQYSARLTDVAGKNIGQWNFIRNTNSETTSLKTEEPLVSGIYILQCQSDSKQFTQKILIRN